MKKITTAILLMIIVPAMMLSCGKDKDNLDAADNLLGLGGDTWVGTAIDSWLYDSLVRPHNIQVKYKWDQSEFDVSKTLVPPDESKIIPIWSMLRQAWIQPYIDVLGLPFFNKYSPKLFVLSGDFSYNANGSITLGTAEGGRKIVLYGSNRFLVRGMTGYSASRDSAFVKKFFLQTVHHEFGHILHQTIMYPIEFKRVNPALFSGNNWINIADTAARRDGFVTSYASSAYDEDFVETIAIMLVEGRDGFNALVNSIPAGTSKNGTTQTQARAYLRQKEAIVVGYFRQAWNVDFYQLQTSCRRALESFL
ncbi:putative zinc-binding metallopeptidase [Nostoc ellipsosporum NOK]|jgi:substrate import-associated zinc metallohydrolase lipoprotein|nr:putative zinc-binding metallopeptidase [Nostoc ellipsosporum NOK]